MPAQHIDRKMKEEVMELLGIGVDKKDIPAVINLSLRSLNRILEVVHKYGDVEPCLSETRGRKSNLSQEMQEVILFLDTYII